MAKPGLDYQSIKQIIVEMAADGKKGNKIARKLCNMGAGIQVVENAFRALGYSVSICEGVLLVSDDYYEEFGGDLNVDEEPPLQRKIVWSP